MYSLNQNIICIKEFKLKYSSKIFANHGDIFTINKIYEYGDFLIMNKKFHIRLYGDDLANFFETLPERRKRIIKDIIYV